MTFIYFISMFFRFLINFHLLFFVAIVLSSMKHDEMKLSPKTDVSVSSVYLKKKQVWHVKFLCYKTFPDSMIYACWMWVLLSSIRHDTYISAFSQYWVMRWQNYSMALLLVTKSKPQYLPIPTNPLRFPAWQVVSLFLYTHENFKNFFLLQNPSRVVLTNEML